MTFLFELEGTRCQMLLARSASYSTCITCFHFVFARASQIFLGSTLDVSRAYLIVPSVYFLDFEYLSVDVFEHQQHEVVQPRDAQKILVLLHAVVAALQRISWGAAVGC
jgi:hypothetical protein